MLNPDVVKNHLSEDYYNFLLSHQGVLGNNRTKRLVSIGQLVPEQFTKLPEEVIEKLKSIAEELNDGPPLGPSAFWQPDKSFVNVHLYIRPNGVRGRRRSYVFSLDTDNTRISQLSL